MSRWVTAEQTAEDFTFSTADKDNGKTKGTIERIAQYVPAEILAPYTALYSILIAMELSETEKLWGALVMMAAFFIATILYTAKQTPNAASRNAHLMVTPLAFLAWSYTISSAILGALYLPLVGFLLQVIVIAMSIVIKPKA